MLLSTRNFLLYLLAVGFLVVAVATTAITQRSANEATVIMGVTSESKSMYEAEAVKSGTPDREERLRTLRGKIAALGEVFMPEPEPTVVESGAETASEDDGGSLLCANQVVYNGDWTPGPATFTVVEGVRLVTREVSLSTTTASGTTVVTIETKVLAQLPLRSTPQETPSCPATDVVGIAGDGSLIRNNEAGLYSVFGSETLVGYALDGFPIYGTNPGVGLDRCGGTSMSGQYRYHLDAKRPYVLNCFAAAPVSL